MARVLHRPTPVPIASNGGCNTLFPLISGGWVRQSGDAPCSVIPSSLWRGLSGGHVWAKRIIAGSGLSWGRPGSKGPQLGSKQFRHIFLEAVGTAGNLTVGELDAAHSGPGSRPLTHGVAPRVYEPKIEEAAIKECRTALRPLDATWAARTWVPLVLNGTGN